MIYYLIACGLLILQIFDQYLHVIKSVKRLNIIFPLISIFLIFFSATRENVGLDYISYKNIYETIQFNAFSLVDLMELNQYYNIEMSYLIICLISKNFHIVLLVYAILGVGVKCYVINKVCRYKYLALFFYFTYYFLYFDMGVIRQGVAMSFMMLALTALNDNHNARFCIYIAVGSVFHITAVLLLPFIFVKGIEIKMKYLYAASFLCLIVGILCSDMLISFLSGISWSSRILFMFNAYGTIDSGRFTTTIIKGILFLSVLYYVSRYVDSKFGESYLKCYWYGVILMCMLSIMPVLAYRGTQFFAWEKHFFIDSVLSDTKSMQKSEKIAVALMLLMFIAWSFYTMYETLPGSITNNFQSFLPYKSILF